MLNTYIRNNGITQTLINKNNVNHVNEVTWDADYNGDVANISINTNDDGKTDHYNFSLDNSDLDNILNVSSVGGPIDARLKNDFKSRSLDYDTDFYKIKIEDSKHPESIQDLLSPLIVNKKSHQTTHKHRRHKRSKTKSRRKPKSTSKSKSKRFTLF